MTHVLSRSAQIVLYLFSRILLGIGKTLTKRGAFESIGLTHERAMKDPAIFPVFASVVWGCVMWLFR